MREFFYNEQSGVKACFVQGIYKIADVLVHDPDSLSCVNPINVMNLLASFSICTL